MAARLLGLLASLWEALGLAGLGVWLAGPKRFGHLVALVEQDPALEPDPYVPLGRYGTGLNFLCPWPGHGGHRVRLYFRRPFDKGEPVADVRLYNTENADDSPDLWLTLSVLDSRDETRPITAECGACFWLAGGAIVLSTR